ncbi:MAG: hypothetical protein IJT78_03235 [Oscillospiraceae bacterium]|nr:hypothetical protein [Oscillospiraceae bacterium]
MKRRKTAKLIALLLAALMLAALCACGGKGGDQASRPTAYDGKNEYEALLDYADRLEEAGNAEAAALVRARIPQAAAGEAREKIEEYMHNDEQFQMFENMEDAMEIADALKGDK